MKKNKPFYKKVSFWFILVFALAFISQFGETDNTPKNEELAIQQESIDKELEEKESLKKENEQLKKQAEKDSEEKIQKLESEKKLKAKEKEKLAEEKLIAKEKEEKESLSNKMTRDQALSLMEESLGELLYVEYNQDYEWLELTPKDENFMLEMYYVWSGESSRDSWDEMLNSFTTMQIAFNKNTGLDLPMMLVNPLNSDNYLVTMVGGEIVYDFTIAEPFEE